jgi:hypothetical protein
MELMISPLAADVADPAFKQVFEAYDAENGYSLLHSLAAEGLAGHPVTAALVEEIQNFERESLALEDDEATSADDFLTDSAAQPAELADAHLGLDEKEVVARVKRAILRSEVAMGRVRRSL